MYIIFFVGFYVGYGSGSLFLSMSLSLLLPSLQRYKALIATNNIKTNKEERDKYEAKRADSEARFIATSSWLIEEEDVRKAYNDNRKLGIWI